MLWKCNNKSDASTELLCHWNHEVVLLYLRVWPWIMVCVLQLCDFEQSWGTKSIQKKWREDKELGNKIVEHRLDIPGYTLKNSLRSHKWFGRAHRVSYFIGQWFSKDALQPEASASSGNLGEMQSQVRPQTDRIRNSVPGWGHICVFTRPPGDSKTL